MKSLRLIVVLLAMTGSGLSARVDTSQASAGAGVYCSSINAPLSTTIGNRQSNFVYWRPTKKMKLCMDVFDAFGPYPTFGASSIIAPYAATMTAVSCGAHGATEPKPLYAVATLRCSRWREKT